MTKLPRPQTVEQIARLVGGEVVGDAKAVISSVAELAAAGPSDISFLENPKYAAAAAAAPAGCLFLPPQAKDAPCAAKARIIVDEPRRAFAILLTLIDQARRGKAAPTLSPKASIHPSAELAPNVSVGDFCVIEEGAVVGEGTVLMPQSYVGRGARVGKGCLLYPQVVLRDGCSLGDRVIVHPGAVIGADGFGFTTDKKTGRHTKIPQIGDATVGSDVEIGANATIDRAAIGSTVIEDGVQIDNLVQVGHNVRIGAGSVIVSQVGIAGSATIGRGVVLGGQVGVAGHLSICDRTQVGAQSGIMSTVEPDAPGKPGPILFGSPARPHREAFKLQALLSRLPELFDKVKELEKTRSSQKTAPCPERGNP